MAPSDGRFGNMPAPSVGVCDPTHKLYHVSILFRVEYQVPVIRHDAVGKDTHIGAFLSLLQDCFEELVVIARIKNSDAGVGAVDDVVDIPADGDAFCARHEIMLS